jgi:UDP-glucose 4-epimerase
MRILITGGAGFIGSHLSDAFVARGDKVSIIDNMSTGSRKNISHLKGEIRIFEGDIRDQELIDKLVQNTDLILHMAAALGVDNILKHPIESMSVNYHGSENVLKAAARHNKRIIIASTSEVYGKNTSQPLSESHDRVIGPPQKLRWSYSDAKALEESLAHALFLTKKLKVTTIRLFNTVGPRQTGNYGMVIPRFVKSALLNEPIIIFGDGNQTRVFCHVKDVVKAIISLVLNNNSIGEVYNIGGISEISITQLAKLIIEKTNSESQVNYLRYEHAYPIGYEDMTRRVPNLSKISTLTGWVPEFGIDNIIDDVVSDLDHKNFDQP